MIRYVAGRIAQAALVLWGAYTIAYLILYTLPGDTLGIILAGSGLDPSTMTASELAKARAYYGLDQGPVAQYFSLLWKVLHGDFGQSASRNVPVIELISERLPQTVHLALLAVAMSLVAGVGFAYATAAIRWQPLKSLARRLPAVGFSIPVFWMGLLLIQVFAFGLGWFPSTGNEGFRSLVLPAITLAIPSAAVYAQVLIRSLHDVGREPYIFTALAKGLTRGQVQRRHALRNAVLPVLTLIGLQVGHTVSGAVLVETVFARVGIGRLAQESVLAQDVPVVLAIVVISAAAFVAVNLVVDLLYPLLDPRITHAPKVS